MTTAHVWQAEEKWNRLLPLDHADLRVNSVFHSEPSYQLRKIWEHFYSNGS